MEQTPEENGYDKVLGILGSVASAGIQVLGWAVILFVTLISAILNGGKG